jgi:integrase
MPQQKSPPRIYLRGRVYWGRYYDAEGVEHRASTKCRDKEAALQLVKQWERDATDPRRATAPPSATLSAALTLLVVEREAQAKQGKRSADTALFYRKKAGHWLRLLGPEFDLGNLTAALVDEYIDARRKESASASTISKELITLRAALKIAKRRGLFHQEIAALLPSGFSPEYKPRKTFLTMGELELLLPQLTRDRAARVAFAVATSANLRETELARREDMGEEFVLLRGTKRHTRTREVPILFDWQKRLMAFAAEHAGGEKGALFRPWCSYRRDLNAAMARAGIKRAHEDGSIRAMSISSNDLRRTTATWMRAEGVPTDLIAAVLGHRDTRMIDRVYGRLPKEILAARIKGAVDLASDNDCTTIVRKQGASETQMAQMSHPQERAHKSKNPASTGVETGFLGLPRDGVEPPARGFSVSLSDCAARLTISPKDLLRTATVQQLCGNVAPLVQTKARVR